jgi:hypothetical protein
MRNLLLGVFVILGVPALAGSGNSVGNGGDVVVCRDQQGKITSVEVFDIVEARVLRNLKLDIEPAGRIYLPTWEGKISVPLERLERLSPLRAANYRKQAEEFLDNARFVRGVDLTDIPDSDHSIVPTGCRIEQIVIRKEPNFVDDRLYLINEDLWELLDEENKVVLVLHELHYGEALAQNAINSQGARYVNSLLFSGRIDRLNERDFFDALRRSGYRRTDVNGVWFAISPNNKFYDSGKLMEATIEGVQSVRWKNEDGQGLEGKISGTMRWFEMGQPENVEIFCGEISTVNRMEVRSSVFAENPHCGRNSGSAVSFYEAKHLLLRSLTSGEISGWPARDLNPELQKLQFQEISLTLSQKVKAIDLASRRIKVKTRVIQEVEPQPVEAFGKLRFFDNGLLESGMFHTPLRFVTSTYDLTIRTDASCTYHMSSTGELLLGVGGGSYMHCMTGWAMVAGQKLQGNFTSSESQRIHEVGLTEGNYIFWNVLGTSVRVKGLLFDNKAKLQAFSLVQPAAKISFPIQGQMRKVSFEPHRWSWVRFHPGTEVLTTFIAEEIFPLKLRDGKTRSVKRSEQIYLEPDGYPASVL